MPIPALIGAAGGIFSSFLGNRSNKKIAQMNNEFNERMLDKQIAYNKEMYQTQLGDQWKFYNDAKKNAWDMAEYNSAPAARQRLEAAGLNPFMMLNGGSAGSASFNGAGSAPSAQGINPPSASQYSADFSAMSSGISQAAALMAQKVDREKTAAETEGIHIENQFKAARAMAELNEILSRTDNDKQRVAIEKFMSSIARDTATSQIAVNNQNIANMRAEEKFTILQSLQASKQLSWMDAQNRMDLAQKAADIKLKLQQGALTKAQAEHEVKKMAETVARTSNIEQSTENLKTQNMIAGNQYRFDKDTYDLRVHQIEETINATIRSNQPSTVFDWTQRPIQSQYGKTINH